MKKRKLILRIKENGPVFEFFLSPKKNAFFKKTIFEHSVRPSSIFLKKSIFKKHVFLKCKKSGFRLQSKGIFKIYFFEKKCVFLHLFHFKLSYKKVNFMKK